MCTDGNIIHLYVPIVARVIGESESLKACTACKFVKYQILQQGLSEGTHRSQHKKECRNREAELHDEALFTQPPQKDEDCPICFLYVCSVFIREKDIKDVVVDKSYLQWICPCSCLDVRNKYCVYLLQNYISSFVRGYST